MMLCFRASGSLGTTGPFGELGPADLPERDNFVYWKTNRNIINDLPLLRLCCFLVFGLECRHIVSDSITSQTHTSNAQF